MPDPNSFEARFAALKTRFLEALPAQVEDIRHHWQAWLTAPAEREHIDRMTVLAHTLKGTAGSFGYPQISAISEELEAELRHDSSYLSEHREHIEALISRLENTAD